MSEVDRLLAAFDAGTLVRPRADEANLLDLVTALAGATGVPQPPPRGHAAAIAERLAGAEHVVFVLADGLGAHFLDTLPADAWLPRHLARTLRAPFPSTTAVSITSIATGRWLTEHAAPGWWGYLPARDVVAVLLPYQRLADEHPLETLGIPPEEVFPVPSLVPRMRFAAELVLPAAITHSVYSGYLGGAAARSGYDSLAEASERIAERIAQASAPTYTYWYVSRIDTLAHEFGTGAERTLAAVRELDEQLAVLAERLAALPASTRLIVTADHGHLDVPAGARQMLDPQDPLLGYLRVHPTGDVRALYFHLREGASAAFGGEFRDAFLKRYESGWVLLSADEVDALRLMGPDPLSRETRARIGDFTAIALGAEVMRFGGIAGADRFMRQHSQHGGLSRDEMTVPLAIAG